MSKIQNPVLQRLESQTGEKWEPANAVSDASSADVKKDIRLLTVRR